MPTLNWLGKDKIEAHHMEVPFHVLCHRYGFTACGQTDVEIDSGNKIIHGDNLIALKSLLPQYEGAVDCIYIDPPYNTGNEDWVYNDNVADPRMMKWLGDVVGREGEDLSRHDKWLCMMYPRLQLLNRLMSDNGAIFISIDRNEFAALKIICDAIFNNFVGCISWQRTYSPRNDSKGIVSETEYILVFSKSSDWQPNRLERTDEMDARYKNPDDDWCAWKSGDASAPNAITHQGMVYAIQNPFTGEMVYPPKGRCWTYEQPEMLRIMSQWCPYELRELDDAARRAEICGVPEHDVRGGVMAIVQSLSVERSRKKALGVMERGRWPKLYFTSKGKGGIARKIYLTQTEGKSPTNLWPYVEVGHTDEAKKELKDIFGGDIPFDTPKPVRLIERILRIATRPDSIVLDSFAGSGTTAHAVLKQNRRDGGNRSFILIEMMDYAEDTTAERVKRVINGYPTRMKHEVELFSKKITTKNIFNGAELMAEADRVAAENRGRYSDVSGPKIADNCVKVTASKVVDGVVDGINADFNYYVVGEPLFDADDSFNRAVSVDAIRRYVFFAETGRCVDGSASGYLLGNYQDTAYYLYYEPDGATVLTLASLQRIVAAKAERYVIYADSCSLSADFMDAHNITFKKITRDIKRF